MGRLAEAYVDIEVDQRNLDSGLSQAKGKLIGFAKQANQKLGALGAAAIAGGAAAAGAGLLAAAKKASDLGETLSKVKYVFGQSSGSITGMADDLAKRLGVVKKEALEAASGFGLMMEAAGLSQAKSARLSGELVKLGLDLASFHNLSNEEAFEKLRSGLAGEAEPLRRLGILLSDDAIKAEALAMGLIKTKRELTEGEKVQARFHLIQRQSSSAAGDLERTADSPANLMRKLEGELENAAADFGQNLQGALRDGIKLAHELGAVIQKATGKSAAENVGEYAQAAINTGRALIAPNAFKVAALSALSYATEIIPGVNLIPGLKDALQEEMNKSLGVGKEQERRDNEAAARARAALKPPPRPAPPPGAPEFDFRGAVLAGAEQRAPAEAEQAHVAAARARFLRQSGLDKVPDRNAEERERRRQESRQFNDIGAGSLADTIPELTQFGNAVQNLRSGLHALNSDKDLLDGVRGAVGIFGGGLGRAAGAALNFHAQGGAGGLLGSALQSMNTDEGVSNSARGQLAQFGPLGTMAAGLLGGAQAIRSQMWEQMRKDFSVGSQRFGGAEEFAQFAVSGALERGGEKQLEKLQQTANDKLGEVNTSIQQGFNTLAQRIGQGVRGIFPR